MLGQLPSNALHRCDGSQNPGCPDADVQLASSVQVKSTSRLVHPAVTDTHRAIARSIEMSIEMWIEAAIERIGDIRTRLPTRPRHRRRMASRGARRWLRW